MKTQFEKLSKAEKRVQLAKDVIKQIGAKKFIPTRGAYLENSNSDLNSDIFSEKDYGKQVNELLKNKKCKVCALGSAFVAGVLRANDMVCDTTYVAEGTMRDYLHKYFGFNISELFDIECAFEGFLADGEIQNFYVNYPNKKENLLAIMKNIIKNKGKFKP